MQAEIAALQAEIPAAWQPAAEAYQSQLAALTKAERKYRRALDDAYEPVGIAMAEIASLDGLQAFAPELDAFLNDMARLSDKDAAVMIKTFEGEIKTIDGINPVKSMLSKARRDLAKDKTETGRAKLDEAKQILADEIAWREAASGNALAALQAFDLAVRDNVGLRGQSRLPDHLVTQIASCKAVHKDISLRF